MAIGACKSLSLLRCLSAQPRELPTYVGLIDPREFIAHFSEQVPKLQRMQTLETALGATTAWWTDHKNSTPRWGACQNFLHLRFINQFQEVRSKFNGKNSPQEHLRHSYVAWANIPREEWVHKFVHTLDPIAKHWYMEADLRHGLEYQTKGQNQEASPSNLTVVSPTFPRQVDK